MKNINMCIYYKDRKDLHYGSREHIFLAAIGGKLKLPEGYVSREFNNDISKLEQDFVRESFVSMRREIEGPGKRGSLDEKKATKSIFHILQDQADNKKFSLGYIKMGKPFEISHFSLDILTKKMNINFNKVNIAVPSDLLAAFKNKCIEFDSKKIRIILDEKLPENLILFGIEEKIEENYDFFFAKNPFNTFCVDANTINIIGKGISIEGVSAQHLKYKPVLNRRVTFRIDHLRVYAKMAFNFLAHKEGNEFVLNDSYDELRNWIANGGENKFVSMDANNINPLVDTGISMPDSAHFIIIGKYDGKLVAKLFLYEGLSVIVSLHLNFKEKFSTVGFICDWKQNREYYLDEFIAMHVIKYDSKVLE